MKRRSYALAGALLSLTSAVQVRALGTGSYSNELISAKALGMGGVGVAGATGDLAVSYLNPAGLTSLQGTQLTVGFAYDDESAAFTNAGSLSTQNRPNAGAGQVSGARARPAFLPDFGFSTELPGGKFSIGLSIVNPYGLETHWDNDSPVRYQATDARIRITDFSPAIAYKVNDRFSVGAGADYYDVTDAQISKAVNVNAINAGLGAPSLGSDGGSALTGSGGGWGAHLGVTFKPDERNQIGLVFHSAAKMSLNGQLLLTGLSGAVATQFGGSQFTTDASAPLYIPRNLQLGWAFKPDKRWLLEADAAWYDWYVARQLGINYGNLTPTQSAILQTGTPTQFKPRNTLNFALGADYKATDRLQVRSGAYYEAASLPETNFSAGFVDLPRYGLTAGGTFAFTSEVGVDAAYNAVFYHSRAINQNSFTGGQPGYTGTFSGFANVVAVNLNFKFGPQCKVVCQ